MKLLLLAALITSSAIADNTSAPPDMLVITTQFGVTTYEGFITQFDTEDAISQIEINKAIVIVIGNDYATDHIFTNGFELPYNVNWIWLGDDTNDVEFSGAGQCTMTNTPPDFTHGFYVYLNCFQIQNEFSRRNK